MDIFFSFAFGTFAAPAYAYVENDVNAEESTETAEDESADAEDEGDGSEEEPVCPYRH
ncbi:MAG: hypothetical protein LUE92_08535 [Clostridiales bacterium]|nr:hypothetical protein [Clostridiales bacterium]